MFKNMFLFKNLTLITLLFIPSSQSFGCKNHKNEAIDWYVLYKLPREHNSNSLIKTGYSYMYISAGIKNWTLSNISINDSLSMPGLTLKPLYENSAEMYILYNDETPTGKKDDKLGHTKGVLLSNNTTGFWLVHSVPKYPPETEYYYPESATVFGQSFLCITLNLQNINNVGLQLQYNQPHKYKFNISRALTEKLVHVNAVINNETIQTPPWYRLTALNSTGGTKFWSFAKNKKFGKELYKDWVAPTLKSDLLVETWLNGRGKIPSYCSGAFKTYNVKAIRLPFNISFSSSTDHSKWAVTTSNGSAKNWICVGDMNREVHQKNRGGGTVCVANQDLWREYTRSVTKIEDCKN